MCQICIDKIFVELFHKNIIDINLAIDQYLVDIYSIYTNEMCICKLFVFSLFLASYFNPIEPNEPTKIELSIDNLFECMSINQSFTFDVKCG